MSSNKGVKRGRTRYEDENKEYNMSPPQNKRRRTEKDGAGGNMDENDDTGRTSVIIRIQNNTNRHWYEVDFNDIFDAGCSYDIDRRVPEFAQYGFSIHSGSEDQILLKAKSGAFGVSKGVAGNHTFIDENNNKFTFKWKMPATGDGEIVWKSNDKSLKNAAYYLDKEDGWHVIYFVIKTDGEPNNDVIVKDNVLNTFQDVMGFIPIVGDIANTGIYAARGMAKEAIISALGGATGAIGKGISSAAKVAKMAANASKVNKLKKAQKGVNMVNEATPMIINAADGDVEGAMFAGMSKAKNKLLNKNVLKYGQAGVDITNNIIDGDINGIMDNVANTTNNKKIKKGIKTTKNGMQCVNNIANGENAFDELKNFTESTINDHGSKKLKSRMKNVNKAVNIGTNVINQLQSGDVNKMICAAGAKAKSKINNKINKETQKLMQKLSDLMVTGAKTMNKSDNFVFKTQFGYITLDKSGWWKMTDNKDEATKWNEVLYQGKHNQKYFQVASGGWKGYYLGSHWDNGVGVYKAWGDCAYFTYERYRLRCKSGKSDSYSVKYRKEENNFYCYYRSPQYQECIVIKE